VFSGDSEVRFLLTIFPDDKSSHTNGTFVAGAAVCTAGGSTIASTILLQLILNCDQRN